MEIEMVFNELSAVNPANDKFQSRDLMSQLVMTLQAATKRGVSRILRTQEDINLLELAPEYTVSKWRNDPEVDLETKRFMRSLMNKAPYYQDTIAEIKSRFDLADVSFKGQKSEGLRFAAITNSIAISLASNSDWNKSTLLLDLEQINDDDIISSSIEIKHASSKQHIEEITSWIRAQLSSDVRDGKQLWLDRSKLFDRIDFCDSVENQLIEILSGDPKLRCIANIFSELNQRCQIWTDGSLDLKGLDESGESESTMNNKSYRDKRIFKCPDGEKRVFDRHIKLRVFNWRIHFLAETPGRVVIGYIGTHLPTTKYKT